MSLARLLSTDRIADWTVRPSHIALTGSLLLSKLGRTIGLLVALAMFLFSCFHFLETGDWVAAVFAAGSLGYLFFFYVIYRGGGR